MIDITPAELKGPEFPDWAEPISDPSQINWSERQSQALVPFVVVNGYPINPVENTGKTGRNLGKWGENQAADPIVIAQNKVLLIQRDDCGEWAIPGGMVEPGEFAKKALVRELKEETGVDLYGMHPVILDRLYVADPRNSNNAWICSTVALFELEEVVFAKGSDDAMDAHWFDFSSMTALESDIAEQKQGKLYEAHRPILQLAMRYMEV